MNVCWKYERIALPELHGKKMRDLAAHEKNTIYREMEELGVEIWNDTVQYEKYMKRQKIRRQKRLEAFLEKRHERRLYQKMQSLANVPDEKADEVAGDHLDIEDEILCEVEVESVAKSAAENDYGRVILEKYGEPKTGGNVRENTISGKSVSSSSSLPKNLPKILPKSLPKNLPKNLPESLPENFHKNLPKRQPERQFERQPANKTRKISKDLFKDHSKKPSKEQSPDLFQDHSDLSNHSYHDFLDDSFETSSESFFNCLPQDESQDASQDTTRDHQSSTNRIPLHKRWRKRAKRTTTKESVSSSISAKTSQNTKLDIMNVSDIPQEGRSQEDRSQEDIPPYEYIFESDNFLDTSTQSMFELPFNTPSRTPPDSVPNSTSSPLGGQDGNSDGSPEGSSEDSPHEVSSNSPPNHSDDGPYPEYLSQFEMDNLPQDDSNVSSTSLAPYSDGDVSMRSDFSVQTVIQTNSRETIYSDRQHINSDRPDMLDFLARETPSQTNDAIDDTLNSSGFDFDYGDEPMENTAPVQAPNATLNTSDQLDDSFDSNDSYDLAIVDVSSDDDEQQNQLSTSKVWRFNVAGSPSSSNISRGP